MPNTNYQDHPDQPRYCGSCGSMMEPGINFCGQCGEPVNIYAAEQEAQNHATTDFVSDSVNAYPNETVFYPQPQSEPKGSKKLIFLIVFLGIVFALLVVYLGYRFMDRNGFLNRADKVTETIQADHIEMRNTEEFKAVIKESESELETTEENFETTEERSDNTSETNYESESADDNLAPEEKEKTEVLESETELITEESVPVVVESIKHEYIRNVDASSYLDESAQLDIIHYPIRAIDGNLDTGWVEGVPGQGYGESITINFIGEYRVTGMKIHAGYQTNNDLYYKNSRPKEIKIIFSDGSSENFTLDDIFGAQDIVFANPVVTNHLTLEIVSVYLGSKFKDTAIMEISLY